ncbi:alpha/beta hydrolase [Nocardioides insulae]|uniref:alpha/beta hydrolase n=1 Tax=Nocardioides insulae TaxID=394734 RepID=UPI0004191760|nr:alpha/beta hydrolase [Nocardioides insulae]
MTRTDLTFTSAGVICRAWHLEATTDALAAPGGRPCVVMAHGLGATRDSGLEEFAAAFAEAGCDAVVFDYRGFGASDGEPRQFVDIPGQVADYHAAIDLARSLPGVDPDRIVVWGVSLSGGHAFTLAARDHRLAAAVAMTPAPDGRAAAKLAREQGGLRPLLRTMPTVLRDVLAARRGRAPVTMPLAGRPGSSAAMTAPGVYESYTSLGGPGWRNEIVARSILKVGSYRPVEEADQIGCPVLVQIGDLDQSAPPLAAAEAAERVARAEVRHYPCDHFDVYPGQPWHDAVLNHQVDFLRRHLAPVATVTHAPTPGA